MSVAETTGPAPRTPRREVLLALVVAGIIISNLVAVAWALPAARLVGGAFAAVLIAAQWRLVPGGVKRTGGAMLAVSLVILAVVEDPLLVLEQGLRSTVSFLSIVAAVSLLGARAGSSPAVNRVGLTLAETARQRAYGPIAVIAHLVSAGLSLAGTAVMMSCAGRALPHRDDPAQRLAFSAIVRSFCLAIAWTPMMGNMALLLAIYDLEWLDVLPVNLGMSTVMLCAFILYERARRGRAAAGPLPPGLGHAFAMVAIALLTVVPVLVIAGKLTGLPVSAIIVLAAAPGAALWAWAERHPTEGGPVAQVGRDAVIRFPSFAGEALLFLGAGLSSSAIAAIIPGDVAAGLGWVMGGSAGVFFLFTCLAISLTCFLGLHPALPALLIVNVLTPEVLGLSPVLHMAALLTGWSLANMVAPFTVIGLMTSRATGRPPHRVMIGWNLASACVVAPVGAVAMEVISRLG